MYGQQRSSELLQGRQPLSEAIYKEYVGNP
jgi:hypothetical protein